MEFLPSTRRGLRAIHDRAAGCIALSLAPGGAPPKCPMGMERGRTAPKSIDGGPKIAWIRKHFAGNPGRNA
jgi:hypothetical protein